MSKRTAAVKRKTTETDVSIDLVLDGDGTHKIETGIGFFDHMLSQVAVQGLFNLTVRAVGDLCVDDHHTVEDVGLVFGTAILDATGERVAIRRYGASIVPMDESLALVSIDLSGRSGCWVETSLTGNIGSFDTELVEEFFAAFARGGKLTLHARVLAGGNRHHMTEALFKAFGRALDEAVAVDARRGGAASSKGTLL